MKKLLFILILLGAVAAGYVYMNLGGYAKQVIETAGTDALGTRLRLGGVDISIQKMRADIGKLEIDQPKGYSGTLLKAKSISVTVSEASEKLVVLDEVVVDGMQVNYIRTLKGDNFDRLQAGMKKSPASSQPAPKVAIRKLRIINTQLSPSVEGLLNSPVRMPDITMTDIGTKEKPVTVGEASTRIVNRVVNAGTNTVVKNQLTKPIKGVTKSVKKGLKGLFD